MVMTRLGDFQSNWVSILHLNTIRFTPSFYRKDRFVSITFSSRDTRTIGLIFHQNESFDEVLPPGSYLNCFCRGMCKRSQGTN